MKTKYPVKILSTVVGVLLVGGLVYAVATINGENATGRLINNNRRNAQVQPVSVPVQPRNTVRTTEAYVAPDPALFSEYRADNGYPGRDGPQVSNPPINTRSVGYADFVQTINSLKSLSEQYYRWSHVIYGTSCVAEKTRRDFTHQAEGFLHQMTRMQQDAGNGYAYLQYSVRQDSFHHYMTNALTPMVEVISSIDDTCLSAAHRREYFPELDSRDRANHLTTIQHYYRARSFLGL